jgi:hypothetical protein
MKIKNRKARRIFWEIRRHCIIIAVYAVFGFALAFAVCLIVGLPEMIGNIICALLGC